jgi:hypothetical protein
MSRFQMFHTGIVVTNLDQAMKDFGGAFGLSWAPPRESSSDLYCPTGIGKRQVKFTYSREGPHYLELVEQIDATAYEQVTGGPRIDHIGFHVEDIVGES